VIEIDSGGNKDRQIVILMTIPLLLMAQVPYTHHRLGGFKNQLMCTDVTV
jgi:hypothetical protein